MFTEQARFCWRDRKSIVLLIDSGAPQTEGYGQRKQTWGMMAAKGFPKSDQSGHQLPMPLIEGSQSLKPLFPSFFTAYIVASAL